VPPDIWASEQYRKIEGPRVQAVLDLLARVRHPGPRVVLDLGCGPGDYTELIARQWPSALVIGVDISPNMINAARQREQPGHLEFRLGDLVTWQPPDPVDVMLANAALQWVPSHVEVLGSLASRLAPGGILGFQMPGIMDGRVPVLLEIARDMSVAPRWRDQLGTALTNMGGELLDPAGYISALAEAGLQAEAWETRYAYLLGDGGLVQFASGSFLRPALSRLEPAEAGEFLAEYKHKVDKMQLVSGGKHGGELLLQERVFAIGRSAPAVP